MSATYNASLPTDRDWVRFSIGDRGLTNAGSPGFAITGAKLQDEEINAVLLEEQNKYLAAARCGEVILAQSRDVIEKVVDDLRLKFGTDPKSAYRTHLRHLREEGCRRTLLASGNGSAIMRNW